MNPLQTAILRHTTTDGLHHFDWRLAGSQIVLPEARETLCWRCPRLLTAMAVREHMIVQALCNHRGLYLTLNSAHELDGGRGTVEPVARGWAQELQTEMNTAETNLAAPHTTTGKMELTTPTQIIKERMFVLRFEHTPTLFVSLQGDRLTRVEHVADLNLLA